MAVKNVPAKQDELTELSDMALRRLKEAVNYGTITLEKPDGTPGTVHSLTCDQLIGVCQSLATIKIKKPQLISTPEDFTPPDTTGD